MKALEGGQATRNAFKNFISVLMALQCFTLVSWIVLSTTVQSRPIFQYSRGFLACLLACFGSFEGEVPTFLQLHVASLLPRYAKVVSICLLSWLSPSSDIHFLLDNGRA